MADYKTHAELRCIALVMGRMLFDKFMDKDVGEAPERIGNEFMYRTDGTVGQPALKTFHNMLQQIENFHHMRMNEFSWRRGKPDENELPFLDPDHDKETTDGAEPPSPPKPEDKQPEGKRIKKPEPPPEGGTAT